MASGFRVSVTYHPEKEGELPELEIVTFSTETAAHDFVRRQRKLLNKVKAVTYLGERK